MAERADWRQMGEEEASFGAGYERKVVCMSLMRSPSRLR
jgi:hypothetical protein